MESFSLYSIHLDPITVISADSFSLTGGNLRRSAVSLKERTVLRSVALAGTGRQRFAAWAVKQIFSLQSGHRKALITPFDTPAYG